MKNTAIILLVGILALSMSVDRQPRIGHVYMEQVLMQMKEAQEMNIIIERFMAEKQLELDRMDNLISDRTRNMEQRERKGELTEAGRIIALNELKSLKTQREETQQQAEQELMSKRTELIRPIAQKLQKAMREVADKEGYTHVLNSADGTANSIVIVAPEGDDLTLRVMKHLGIE
jgi:outer membrane protein